jgi:hypothetical protein
MHRMSLLLLVHIKTNQLIRAHALPLLCLFLRRTVQARTVAEPIIATVSLMAESGLPCFSRGAPVANLRRRFHLEMSDAQVGIAVIPCHSCVPMQLMAKSVSCGVFLWCQCCWHWDVAGLCVACVFQQGRASR